jgi:uncharacterized protein YecT (DUF1311 family)
MEQEMKVLRSVMKLGQVCGIPLIPILALTLVAEVSHAQSRKPTAREVAAIRDCVDKNKDDIDEGERRCLFNLVADPCIGDVSSAADRKMTDCYEIEGSIWDDLLNENYKRLLDALDSEQTAKARTMQRAWVAYRDTTCQFYYDKIQGTMAIHMQSACVMRENQASEAPFDC